MVWSINSSLVASATFFITGVVTTHVFHRDLPAISTTDWSLDSIGSRLLAFQAVPLALSVLLYNLVRPAPCSVPALPLLIIFKVPC